MKEVMSFYDYIEIQPISLYDVLVRKDEEKVEVKKEKKSLFKRRPKKEEIAESSEAPKEEERAQEATEEEPQE